MLTRKPYTPPLAPRPLAATCIMLTLMLAACTPDPPASNFHHPIATERILFTGEGRLFYTISAYGTQDIINKIRWSRPDRHVTEEVINVGSATIDASNVLTPKWGVTAAYCAGARPHITMYPSWRDSDLLIEEGTYHITGRLMDSSGEAHPFFNVEGPLVIDNGTYSPITTDASYLKPYTAKLYTLEIESIYTLPSGEWRTTTRTPFVTTLRCPLPGVPLYDRLLRWGGQFLDGTYEGIDTGTEQQVAQRLLEGLPYIEALGHSYGPFARPSEYEDSIEVFLDYPVVACGEMATFFMGLMETQGIDANIAVYAFTEPGPTVPSMYETYPIAAMGTGEKVWRYQNHAVTQVNGVVYDPTYLISSPNLTAHEDFLFERFCYGVDRDCKNYYDWCTTPSGPQGICIDNSEGWVEDESPTVLYRETYN